MTQGNNDDENEGGKTAALRILIQNPVMDRLTMFVIRTEGNEISLLLYFILYLYYYIYFETKIQKQVKNFCFLTRPLYRVNKFNTAAYIRGMYMFVMFP